MENALLEACRPIFIGMEIFLAIMVAFCLVRAILGPRIADRVIAVNMMGTMIMVMIAGLSLILNEGYLLDISLIYAMISFLSVVLLTKIYMGVYVERTIRKGEKKNDTV